MNSFVKIEKNVPVAGNYDVVVCGGGPAGFIAAIAAARQGVRTALIERYGFLFLTYFTLYNSSRFIYLIRTDLNVFLFIAE